MLTSSQIDGIVTDVARDFLKPQNFRSTFHEAAVASDGGDALRITIVVDNDAPDRLAGEAIVNTLYNIRQRLTEAGEDRFPIVEYATEEELASGGSES